MQYSNKSNTIIADNIKLSKYALDIYQDLNNESFTSSIIIPNIFKQSLEYILQKHNQQSNLIIKDIQLPKININNNVLLACSGGLDSIYQAFILKEQGYNVILFHCKNINYYTNGREYQIVKDFANKYNFQLVTIDFKQNPKYKKYWKENSFKNLLIYSLMYDYCYKYGIGNISTGDDLRLNLKDAIIGTNIADASEITLAFINNLPINTIFVDKTQHKGLRLEKLIQYNAINDFYSCVNPGRFNQSNHNRISNKYKVNMEKYNCGVCRKCAFHSLLRYYYLHEPYSKEFIDFCWEKICIGADYEFFKPSLSLNRRIKNLYEY